jgi:hypothetical protein
LIARMDGRQTVADIFEQARQDQELPENFRQEAFSDLVRMLIGRGFLVVE